MVTQQIYTVKLKNRSAPHHQDARRIEGTYRSTNFYSRRPLDAVLVYVPSEDMNPLKHEILLHKL